MKGSVIFMPTAKKLPSGSWRCQVFSHYEETLQKDGSIKKKRIYKSFTVNDPTKRGKKICEQIAAEWALNKKGTAAPSDDQMLTVSQALLRYIDIKKNVLSPSTVGTYKNMAEVHYNAIADIRLCSLTSSAVQKWINDIAADKSPKTVSNIYGLLSAALRTFCPDKSIRIQLPAKTIYRGYVPTDNDINKIIEYAAGNDKNMLVAISLGAFGTLRRSEICALDADDVDRDKCTIHVHRAMILNDQNEYVIKDTAKTKSSDRFIQLPEDVIRILPTAGRVVPYDPRSVTKRFLHIIDVCDVPRFRFHDLRHYSASVMHALGVPDVYIMHRGGWSSDHTLKQIYRGSMDDYEKKFTVLVNDHYQKLMQHDMQHEKERAL